MKFTERGLSLCQLQRGYGKEKGGDQDSVSYQGQGGERALAPATCFQLNPWSLAGKRDFAASCKER